MPLRPQPQSAAASPLRTSARPTRSIRKPRVTPQTAISPSSAVSSPSSSESACLAARSRAALTNWGGLPLCGSRQRIGSVRKVHAVANLFPFSGDLGRIDVGSMLNFGRKESPRDCGLRLLKSQCLRPPSGVQGSMPISRLFREQRVAVSVIRRQKLLDRLMGLDPPSKTPRVPRVTTERLDTLEVVELARPLGIASPPCVPTAFPSAASVAATARGSPQVAIPKPCIVRVLDVFAVVGQRRPDVALAPQTAPMAEAVAGLG